VSAGRKIATEAKLRAFAKDKPWALSAVLDTLEREAEKREPGEWRDGFTIVADAVRAAAEPEVKAERCQACGGAGFVNGALCFPCAMMVGK
jgi:hypothetical protein